MIDYQWLKNLPKAELHLHIEGTLEPELLLHLAERNKVDVPYSDVDALKKAYQFDDLKSFLDLYYQGMNVLKTEQDFYELAMAYFKKMYEENVKHVEIFFDPQAHTLRGLRFDTVIQGLQQARLEAEHKYDLSVHLILSFLRDQPVQSAYDTLIQAKPYYDWIIGVGLDSAEKNNPPKLFEEIFSEARALGLRAVAHAGEEGPAEYIAQALDLLKVERVDHGVRCLEDDIVVARLAEQQTPLTVCPLSNLKLKVVSDMKAHPIQALLDKNLCVTLNSDDPAYFGGYLTDNFYAVAECFNWDQATVLRIIRNSFDASFISAERRAELNALLT